MDLKRSIIIDHRVACIIPTIEPRHIIRLSCKKIHNLALAFITPLCADYCCDCHASSDIHLSIIVIRIIDTRLSDYFIHQFDCQANIRLRRQAQ